MTIKSLLALLALTACDRGHAPPRKLGPCEVETRADVYTAGLHKRGTAGAIDFALTSAEPGPPARGDNTWLLQLDGLGASGGALADATVSVTPFMPDHGHGTTVKVDVTPMPTPGQYRLSPINLWMPGYWETSIHASYGQISDDAVFKFCIPK